MVIINLRRFYPFYFEDCFVEVSDDVADMLIQADHDESAFQR